MLTTLINSYIYGYCLGQAWATVGPWVDKADLSDPSLNLDFTVEKNVDSVRYAYVCTI